MNRNWQRLYYLIVLFDIVAVGAGLYLTHRITDMFEASIAATRASNQRRLAYSELGRLASEIHAPASDAFKKHDIAQRERELQQALTTFERALQATRVSVTRSVDDPLRQTVLDDLTAVEKLSVHMVEDAHRLFEAFRQNDRGTAGGELAEMNRHYADLNRRVTKLRQDATASEDALLDRQYAAVDSLKGYQALLGAALLVIIGASGLYGHRMSERAQAHLLERENYIRQLRESEASLEQRVLERTEALRKAEERLRLAARAANDALWDWDIETGTLWWNEAWGTLFGHSTPDPTFAFWMSVVHPDDAERVSGALRQFIDSVAGDVWRAEYRLRRANGNYAWVLDRAYLVRGEDRRARRLIGAMMDITERKEAERMKSDFVSFVSHQLRTPLAGMSWMLELAADSDDVPPTTREYIAEARESGARLVTDVPIDRRHGHVVFDDEVRSAGFTVEAAADGAKGLAAIASFQPDVLLLDLVLPAIDGLTLLRKLRADPASANMPVIVFSNAFSGERLNELWEAGATHVLAKANSTPKQVVDAVRAALAQRAGGGSAS